MRLALSSIVFESGVNGFHDSEFTYWDISVRTANGKEYGVGRCERCTTGGKLDGYELHVFAPIDPDGDGPEPGTQLIEGLSFALWDYANAQDAKSACKHAVRDALVAWSETDAAAWFRASWRGDAR